MAFEKDFVYLMPFLDKITEAAITIPNREAREELIRLLVGEKQRWDRIRRLMSGASTATAASTELEPQQASTSAKAIAGETAARTGFTVGSLRRRSE